MADWIRNVLPDFQITFPYSRNWCKHSLIIKVCYLPFCPLVTPPLRPTFKCCLLSALLLRAGSFEEYSCFISFLNGEISQIVSQGHPTLFFTTAGPSIEMSNNWLWSTHWLAGIKHWMIQRELWILPLSLPKTMNPLWIKQVME